MILTILRSLLLAALTAVTLGGLGFVWYQDQQELITERQKIILDLSSRDLLATPLQARISAQEGDAETLKILGDLGVSFDTLDSEGRDLVHIAMDHHRWEALEVIRKYAKHEDRPHEAGDTAKTPLHKLLDKGYLNLAQNFVDHGANVDFCISTEKGKIPASIHYLRSKNNKNFEFVINNAADLNVIGAGGKSLLQVAIEEGHIAETLKLIKYGAEISDLKLADRNAFIELMENPSKYHLDEEQQIKLLAVLIQRGVDVNVSVAEEEGTKLRPLTIAIREENLPVFELLIQHVKKDQSYLWEAIHFQRPEMLRSLLQSGIKADSKNEEGETPFVAMLKQGDSGAADIMNILLDHGADPDQMTAEGQRALFVAIAAGKSAVAQALITHPNGADVNEPMDYPVTDEFRELFGKKGRVDWYIRKVKGLTPLMVAVLSDDLYVAESLVKKGAKRNQATPSKSYPIYMASGMKNVKMEQLILGVPFEDDQQEREFIIDLSDQKAYLYKKGKLIKASRCSTGKRGYRSPTGGYVITDKHRNKVSNIYKGAQMPYFQRFSGSAIGFHYGNTYAGFLSHGCIRLPMSSAKFFFENSKVGDRVTIRQ